MFSIPVKICVTLAICAVTASLYIGVFGEFSLTDAELIQIQIAIAATLGALISATVVVYSYLQTNFAFIENQRPQLLIWIQSQRGKRNDEDTDTFPLTFIHYENITKNQFSDLTLQIEVVSGGRTVLLNDLFRPKMVMIGHDKRQKWFETYKEIKSRGLDIKEAASRGNSVSLRIGYKYSFGGREFIVQCQDYQWNPRIEQWELP